MSLTLILHTISCVIAISLGQLMFKKGAQELAFDSGWLGWLTNGWLIAALILYGLTTLAWIWILRHAPLNLAYPFMGLAFIIVPTLAWLLLGEPLHWRTLAGGVLILLGVSLAASGGSG